MRNIRSSHYRVYEDDEGRNPLHIEANCIGQYCKGDPAAFLYGRSTFIKRSALPGQLRNWMNTLITHNRTEAEKADSDYERTIILVSWDSQAEENTLWRYGIKWFKRVSAWDLQKFQLCQNIARQAFNKGNGMLKLEELMKAINHPYQNPDLVHNGGNDATFELQGMLSILLMDNSQRELAYQKLTLEPIPLPPVGSYTKTLNQNRKDETELEQARVQRVAAARMAALSL